MQILLGRVEPFESKTFSFSLQRWSNPPLNLYMLYLNSSILVLQKALSDLLVCRILKIASEYEKLKKIFSSWNWNRNPLEEIEVRVQKKLFLHPIPLVPVIDTEDPQFLLCIHAQFQQSALVQRVSAINGNLFLRCVSNDKSFLSTWQIKF
jgi:hypothetical protein